jgi:hypothetical protein
MKVGDLLQFGDQKPSFDLGVVLGIEKAGAEYGSADDRFTIYMKWIDPNMRHRNPVHVWQREYVERAFKVLSK